VSREVLEECEDVVKEFEGERSCCVSRNMRKKPDHGGRTPFINIIRSFTITLHLAALPKNLRMINTRHKGEPEL
jgi:hypothetical protein